MYFQQFIVDGMGCMSYLIGCPAARVACVVDPKRDVQDYIDKARANGMKITHIFETHVHADHVSGNMELKSRTGAQICMHKHSPVTFDFTPVSKGDTIELGNARLEIAETPGHTPHSLSILVTDKSRGDDPWVALTGDCLFVGDIGRPDLAGKELIMEQAQNLYHSLHDTLGTMPESLEVFPAHGQGSLCGKGMSAKPSSTIGFEWRHNPVLNLSETDFISEMTQTFPDRPKSFTHIIETNKKGAPLLERCPIRRDFSPAQFKELVDSGATILDARDTASFGGVHIPGAINIGLANQTANWTGMVIEPSARLVLVVPSEKAYDQMCLQLHRIGYDEIYGYLYGGIAAWQESGYPIAQLWQISPARLKEKLDTGRTRHVIDVRTAAERSTGSIPGSMHLPINKLFKSPPDIPKNEEIVVTCAVGYRGNIAASFLSGQGFDHVHSIAGGLKAWINAGYPLA